GNSPFPFSGRPDLQRIVSRLRFHNKYIERGRGYLAFLPVWEGEGDLGRSCACFVRDPHGAVEKRVSRVRGEPILHSNGFAARGPVGNLDLDGRAGARQEFAGADTGKCPIPQPGRAEPGNDLDDPVVRAGVPNPPLWISQLHRQRAVEMDDGSRFGLLGKVPACLACTRTRVFHLEALQALAPNPNGDRERARLDHLQLQVGVPGAVRFGEGADLEPSFRQPRYGFAGFGEVAVAVAVHVKRVAVDHEPDAELRLRAEDQQAILRLALVSRLLGDGAVDLSQVDSQGWRRAN